jgi:hypothetical protein
VNSVHPGVVAMEFGSRAGSPLLKLIMTMFKPWMLDSKQGSATGLYVATSSEVSQVSGEYFVKSKPAKPNPPRSAASAKPLANERAVGWDSIVVKRRENRTRSQCFIRQVHVDNRPALSLFRKLDC